MNALARRLLVPVLCLPCVACAATHSGPEGDGRTYQGLTLAEWRTHPWYGEGRFTEGVGTVTFQRNGRHSVEALAAFASDSRAALDDLRRLAGDLEEDTRDEAAEALVDLAFSREPNEAAARAVVLGLVERGDEPTCASVLGQLIGHVDEEPGDWERLGPEGEALCARRIELLLFGRQEDSVSIALEAIAVMARRSESHERAFRELLSRPASAYVCPDAAGELEHFARHELDEDEAPLTALAVLAARRASELEPAEADYLGTLALAHWKADDEGAAREAARSAMEAAVAEVRRKERSSKSLESFGERLAPLLPPGK